MSSLLSEAINKHSNDEERYKSALNEKSKLSDLLVLAVLARKDEDAKVLARMTQLRERLLKTFPKQTVKEYERNCHNTKGGYYWSYLTPTVADHKSESEGTNKTDDTNKTETVEKLCETAEGLYKTVEGLKETVKGLKETVNTHDKALRDLMINNGDTGDAADNIKNAENVLNKAKYVLKGGEDNLKEAENKLKEAEKKLNQKWANRFDTLVKNIEDYLKRKKTNVQYTRKTNPEKAHKPFYKNKNQQQ